MAKTYNMVMVGGAGGGGDFPFNVTNFTGVALDDTVTLKWTDPSETDAPDWIGTKIVIKKWSYPTHENDGTAIVDSMTRNQFQTVGFDVTGLEEGVTYYPQAFPYSRDGISNNVANRIPPITINFVYPLPLVSFSITSGNGELTPVFTLPYNATSCRIVYKTGSTPSSMTDGTVIEPAISGTPITGLTNDETYYFRAFPKNQFGRYNEEIAGNQASAVPGELIPRSGLIAEYTMDSVSGNILLDTSNSGTAYNGTIGSTVTFPAGKIGNCANFPANASTGKISFADPVIPQGAKSISGWIYINSFIQGGRFIDNRSTSYNGICFLTLSANSFRIDIGNNSTFVSVSATGLSANTWYYFCFVWDGTNAANGIKLFYNNTWRYSTFSGVEPVAGHNLALGASPVTTDIAGNVRLDQVRIYNRAITDDEVMLLSNEVVGV